MNGTKCGSQKSEETSQAIKPEPAKKNLPNTGSADQSFMTYSALVGLATAGYALSRKKKRLI